MDACRAINEMVFAMLFVVAVGLGPFAGVLALFIHTTGVLSKLLSEAVEAIEPGPVEGIRATGANKLERDPLRRAATGDAAADLLLPLSFRIQRPLGDRRRHGRCRRESASPCGKRFAVFQFQQTCALMVLIIVTVSLLDFLSQRLRKHFI
ncbi:phosphonates transport system, permease protein [Escherichia coli]|nr:phosphonates transport system, permease protein [Escherichia coli]